MKVIEMKVIHNSNVVQSVVSDENQDFSSFSQYMKNSIYDFFGVKLDKEDKTLKLKKAIEFCDHLRDIDHIIEKNYEIELFKKIIFNEEQIIALGLARKQFIGEEAKINFLDGPELSLDNKQKITIEYFSNLIQPTKYDQMLIKLLPNSITSEIVKKQQSKSKQTAILVK
jgi:hypothetical protein